MWYRYVIKLRENAIIVRSDIKTNMIDVHSHIIPGLDDGSKSYEESLEMLKEAYSQGISTVIATPHLSPIFRKYSTETAKERFKKLEEQVRGLPGLSDMELYLGQEVFWCEEGEERIRDGEFLTMAGSSYVLIEFFPDTAFYEIVRAVRETLTYGYTPVLAHVERFFALGELSKVSEIRGMGARIQMNYRSVSGGFFDKRAAFCRKLLKAGVIDLMGTDMHDMDSRKPETSEAVRWMEKHLDQGYCQRLLRGNAKRIIQNERI